MSGVRISRVLRRCIEWALQPTLAALAALSLVSVPLLVEDFAVRAGFLGLASLVLASFVALRAEIREQHGIVRGLKSNLGDSTSSTFALGRTGIRAIYIGGRGVVPEIEKSLGSAKFRVSAVIGGGAPALGEILAHSRTSHGAIMRARNEGVRLRFIIISRGENRQIGNQAPGRLLSQIDRFLQLGVDLRISMMDAGGSMLLIDHEAFVATRLFGERAGMIFHAQQGEVTALLEDQFERFWSESVDVPSDPLSLQRALG